MIKNSTTVFALGLVAVSCSSGISRVQTLALSTPNPTTYSFPLPLEEVETKAWRAFSIEHQVEHPIFGRPSVATHLERTLFAECATNAVFGKAVFLDPADSHDIYLHTFDTPFVMSSVYRGRDGALPFTATFHLHLAASGSNTIVNVIACDTKVVNGRKYGVGPCGPGWGGNWERVRPTTVEEYSILRYLGSYLDIANMPNVILPAQGVD
jgi:hypothetical protein